MHYLPLPWLNGAFNVKALGNLTVHLSVAYLQEILEGKEKRKGEKMEKNK